jgi:hypothetical protein
MKANIKDRATVGLVARKNGSLQRRLKQSLGRGLSSEGDVDFATLSLLRLIFAKMDIDMNKGLDPKMSLKQQAEAMTKSMFVCLEDILFDLHATRNERDNARNKLKDIAKNQPYLFDEQEKKKFL